MNTTIKTLLYFLFISFSSICYSQTNLQFNNVITQVGTVSGGYGQQVASPTFTVPQGKVWKLERYRRDVLFVNGVNIKDSYVVGNSSAIAIDNAPLWLNEGDTFYFLLGAPPYSWTDNWYFSALEFNKN
jgi:hypothetical protein